MKGTERALVFGSGYLANLGVIPALVGKNDLILADRLSHACTWDGTRLSGATVMRFDHNSLEHCAELLAASTELGFEHCLILTETVFSMEGDRGPIAELAALARAHDAWLMTDDAHGLGICSAHEADVQMGTLSKAAGSYGGYVCARSEVIAFLENKARSLLFATGLPPASVAAAVGRTDDHDGRPGAGQKADGKRAADSQRALGRAAGAKPDRAGDRGRSRQRLWRRRPCWKQTATWSSPIRPPTVPPGTARLRFAFSAMHRADDIDRAAALLKAHGYA